MKSELTKIAAECHRAKWAFDLSDDYLPTRREGHRLARMAFEELHRIGDMVLKMRDANQQLKEAET